ncbi:MAG TPA: DUF4407 domain-containing protein [Williamwhitmania sp.]|nr:DUF4407 domain-containing protein [Williamwhitmania sp.]
MTARSYLRRSSLPFFYRVFCWCSGARLYLLERCPSDLNKFLGIGAVILMTGILASLSGGYAIYTIFRSPLLAVLFGMLWGLLIFFLDFFLVSSLKKQDRVSKEMPFAIPRFVLAILIAIVISKPIELKLFEREINVEIEAMQSAKNIEISNLVDKEFGEISQLTQENEQLKADIAAKEQSRNQLFDMIVAEAEGKSPTGKVGKGPVYSEKKAEFDKTERELETVRKENQTQLVHNNERIEALTKQRDERLAQTTQTSGRANGFLARLEAMSNISSKSSIVSIASWFITLLFIVIEASPIIVKLLSKRGPYDFLLEAEEFQKEAEASIIIENIRFGHEESIDVDREVARIKFKSEISLQSEFISEEAEVRRELFRRRLKTFEKAGTVPKRDLKLITKVDDSAEEEKSEEVLAESSANVELIESDTASDEAEQKQIVVDSPVEKNSSLPLLESCIEGRIEPIHKNGDEK